jgi:hypothetical protein
MLIGTPQPPTSPENEQIMRQPGTVPNGHSQNATITMLGRKRQ